MSKSCINCGAAITFEQEGGQLLERLVCPYCGAANLRAQAERLERQEVERAHVRESSSRLRYVLAFGGGFVALVALALGVQLQRTGTSLSARWADVERARAQVQNVKEKQQEVLTRLKDTAPSDARDAEVAGADNRVRIERKRYDEAASAYNAGVDGVLARWAAKASGLPEEAALSSEVRW